MIRTVQLCRCSTQPRAQRTCPDAQHNNEARECTCADARHNHALSAHVQMLNTTTKHVRRTVHMCRCSTQQRACKGGKKKKGGPSARSCCQGRLEERRNGELLPTATDCCPRKGKQKNERGAHTTITRSKEITKINLTLVNVFDLPATLEAWHVILICY